MTRWRLRGKRSSGEMPTATLRWRPRPGNSSGVRGAHRSTDTRASQAPSRIYFPTGAEQGQRVTADQSDRPLSTLSGPLCTHREARPWPPSARSPRGLCRPRGSWTGAGHPRGCYKSRGSPNSGSSTWTPGRRVPSTHLVCAAPAAPSTRGSLTSELLLPVTSRTQGQAPITDQHRRNCISI